MQQFSSKTLIVASRCAWTLANFRLPLIQSALAEGFKVIALGGADGNEQRLTLERVDFRSVPVGRMGVDPLMDLRLFISFIRHFLHTRPHLVHCFTIKPAIYGTLSAWLCRVPVRVVTITGLGHAFTSAPGWLNKLVRVLYRLALRQAHLVYFQNREDLDLFVSLRLVGATRAKLCAGTGVDGSRFAPVPLPSSQRGNPLRFLMVARLIREKGVIEYIRAAEIVHNEHPAVKFCLLGGEDARNPSALTKPEIEELRRSPVVEWLGGTQDVRPYIGSSDVVVLPSYREGLPRSLLEAAAMGRPAIATDTVGCRDVVLHGITGYLVPIKDADALAEAMRRLIAEPTLVQSMGKAARDRVVKEFDEKTVISATFVDYSRLLNQKEKDADTTVPA
jgi:glycosyltransferase involved in cell wall biosynthesis